MNPPAGPRAGRPRRRRSWTNAAPPWWYPTTNPGNTEGAHPGAGAGGAAGAHRGVHHLRHRRAPLARPLGGGDSLPIITGHEPCGYIEEINGERTDILGKPVKPGDRVVWSYVACGHCYYCTVALQPCICPGRASWGHNRSDKYPYLLGSVSEYMYVPPALRDHQGARRRDLGVGGRLRLRPTAR